jgi:farnesyl-diphosphate farnesyltransferase
MNAPLDGLLRQTSRSFHLTLRVLPRAVRAQIGLAYLLARTTDTIADTELIPVEQRLQALHQLRQRILGTSAAPLNFGALARHQGSPAEAGLLERVEESLAALRTLSADDLKLVRKVLDTIASGQELDLRRFAGASAEKISALPTDADLDDYTYRVAGCVGEFWTGICVAHLFNLVELDEFAVSSSFEQLGVRFGKGLQLVNILRDLPADLCKGRCYLPRTGLAEAGLQPADLLSPANEPKFRPLYHRHLDLAESQLAAGWLYTECIPWRQVRIRLACAWPILIGTETIRRLRNENVLDPARRIKISRAEVRGIVARSVLHYAWPRAWRRLFPPHDPAFWKAVASAAKFK